jgi:hypothetical protein
MPRFSLTNPEKQLLGQALLTYAKDNNLNASDALVAAAITTTSEIQAVATQYLNTLKTARQSTLAAIPTQATEATNRVNTEIAAIDSALAKL